MNRSCDLWIEQVREAGDDDELLAEVLEDIFDAGVKHGIGEANAEYEEE